MKLSILILINLYSIALAIAEVEIRDGSAHATSNHPAPWTADKAFIIGHANAWHNGLDLVLTLFPSMVWYEFPLEKTFAPARISFRPRQDCPTCIDQGPTVWQFIGKLALFSILAKSLLPEGIEVTNDTTG